MVCSIAEAGIETVWEFAINCADWLNHLGPDWNFLKIVEKGLNRLENGWNWSKVCGIVWVTVWIG